MACAHCGTAGPENTCAGCKIVFYCGEDCQAADWSAHKDFCKAARKQAKAAPPVAPPPAAAAAAPPPAAAAAALPPAAAAAPPRAVPFVLDLHCGSCGAELGGTVGEKCGACFRVAYCDRTCQKAHWQAHKAACAEEKAALETKRAIAVKALFEVACAKGALDEGMEDVMKHAIALARREAGKEGGSEELLEHSFTYAACLIKVGRSAEARRVIREAYKDAGAAKIAYAFIISAYDL
jgi:hypothetical protein